MVCSGLTVSLALWTRYSLFACIPWHLPKLWKAGFICNTPKSKHSSNWQQQRRFYSFIFHHPSPLIFSQLYSSLERIPSYNPPHLLFKPILYTLRSNLLAEPCSYIVACWYVRWGKSSLKIGSCLVAEDGREEGMLEADVGVV